MNSLFLTFLAAACALLTSLLGNDYLDFNLRFEVLIVCAIFSALYAAGMVVMGETVIEDVVKVLLLFVPTLIITLSEPRFGFLLVCAVCAGGFGMLFNTLVRAVEKRKAKAS